MVDNPREIIRDVVSSNAGRPLPVTLPRTRQATLFERGVELFEHVVEGREDLKLVLQTCEMPQVIVIIMHSSPARSA